VRNLFILSLLVVLSAAGARAEEVAGEVRVGNCIFRGATVLSEDGIKALTGPVVQAGTYPTSCLQAADALELALRKAGAFAARVYIDAPENSPVTVLTVIEGRLAADGVKLGRSSARVDDGVILEQTRQILEPGSVLTADKYERAILLLHDLPGIAGSESTLYPAERAGEANYEVYPKDAALVEGHAYADNFGGASTGEYRVGSAVDINSPFGRGDKFTATANVSQKGTYYLSLDASAPLAGNGLRGGISAGALDYRTDENDDLRGYARDLSAYLHYPMIRSRQTNVYGEARIGREDMKDRNDTSTVTDRFVDTAHLKLSGDRLDGMLGGGKTGFSIEGVIGNTDLDGYEPYRQEDASSAKTAGAFARLAYHFSRLQHLGGPWQGYIEVAGQLASKRLDSSQSISFGGPFDFPGYKSGEVLGDEGHRLHVDARYNVPAGVMGGKMQVSAFYDIGTLTTHAKEFAGNVIVPGVEDKSYTLQSAGLGMSVVWKTVTLQGVVARRINNQIPDRLLDGDSNDDLHGWFQLVYNF
jgi:hemolysin activation/secretion protein